MIEKIVLNTVEELFDLVSPWNNNAALRGYIFRGHSQDSYQLIPTALREENAGNVRKMSRFNSTENEWKTERIQICAEYVILREFYKLSDANGLHVPLSDRFRANLEQNYDPYGMSSLLSENPLSWLTSDLFEVAGLAQHYGLPTRLLDWTYDIYVSMFFAFSGALNNSGNMTIWALNKTIVKMSCFTDAVKFITPHYAGNPNLNAQKGLFTLWPIENHSGDKEDMDLIDRRPLNELMENKDNEETFFKTYTIPCAEASKGLRILSDFGYDFAKMHPGYGGVARQILERLT